MKLFQDKDNIKECKILTVDDSEIALKELNNILEDSGQKVIDVANNGEEALAKYKELKPEIVFMDINMPKSDGIKGLKLIMNYDPKAKVIMATSIGKLGNIIEALNLGAIDYVTKPYNKQNIIKSIGKALKGELK